mmetsp:Transcript_709/g.1458  ORF Transcript_709/g.1458 Transcript_709/m.1458 type:complete len:209 (+) Transcript_709:622-1248(+)
MHADNACGWGVYECLTLRVKLGDELVDDLDLILGQEMRDERRNCRLTADLATNDLGTPEERAARVGEIVGNENCRAWRQAVSGQLLPVLDVVEEGRLLDLCTHTLLLNEENVFLSDAIEGALDHGVEAAVRALVREDDSTERDVGHLLLVSIPQEVLERGCEVSPLPDVGVVGYRRVGPLACLPEGALDERQPVEIIMYVDEQQLLRR